MPLNNDPFPYFDYLNQGQIGLILGVSSHQVGRWLSSLGLRQGKCPSTDALESGLAKEVSDGDLRFYSWEKRRIVERLRREGLGEPVGPAVLANPLAVTLHCGEVNGDHSGGRRELVGPFTCRPNGGDGYEIVSGDGTVGVWARGEGTADCVLRLLNLAYRAGRLG
jgi:hypothetical protein